MGHEKFSSPSRDFTQNYSSSRDYYFFAINFLLIISTFFLVGNKYSLAPTKIHEFQILIAHFQLMMNFKMNVIIGGKY